MLERIELYGSSYEMGLQHGRLLRDKIHGLAQERLEIAQGFCRDQGFEPTRDACLQAARAMLPLHERHLPAAFQEWRGIAEGADLPLEEVFFANALTDFQDVLFQTRGEVVHGCTSFAIAPQASAEGVAYIGQTWDMHASAEQYIAVFHRRPDEGPESLTMTAAGCLTLVGVNSAGVAVGNNNLRPTDARPGVIYLAMLHEALRQTEWSAARAAITEAPRASGHNYILAHKSGERANIETTATRNHDLTISTPRYVHTNHYLADELRPLEDPTSDRASTEARYKRLVEVLESRPEEKLSPESLRELLSDHEGGEELCICRHGEEREARSCAFAVCDPSGGTLWAGLGPPCQGMLDRFDLAD